jgi:hypothetical protein
MDVSFDMLHDYVDSVAKIVAKITSIFLHLLRLENQVSLKLTFNVLQGYLRSFGHV